MAAWRQLGGTTRHLEELVDIIILIGSFRCALCRFYTQGAQTLSKSRVVFAEYGLYEVIAMSKRNKLESRSEPKFAEDI